MLEFKISIWELYGYKEVRKLGGRQHHHISFQEDPKAVFQNTGLK